MLPSNLKYQNKLESAYARSYTTHIQPQNGQNDYTDGQTIIINIPTSPNQVMASTESVLKFDLTVKNGGTASNYIRLDKCGAHGIIRRLRLYHGSNTLVKIVFFRAFVMINFVMFKMTRVPLQKLIKYFPLLPVKDCLVLLNLHKSQLMVILCHVLTVLICYLLLVLCLRSMYHYLL
jgi:hypothetical protein